MPTIRLVNITKQFSKGSKAVDELNLTIEDGHFVSLLGPSGCGKTTTLRMIAGLETPTDGEIYFDDTCVFSNEKGINVSPDKRNVGFLFQNYALWPHMTVRRNIAFGLENMKWDKKKIENRVKEICQAMRIEEYVDRYPAELSGGQQQRVAIARAIAYNPEVVLFDEPTSALDPRLTGEVLDVMRKLADEGTTMVVVTHEMDFARKVANWVVYMEDGVIVEEGPSKEFFSHPKSEKTMAFLHMTNSDFVI